MVYQHHKRLKRAGIESRLVGQYDKIEWLDPSIVVINRYQALKTIKDDDLLVTSWDRQLRFLLGFRKGIKIAFAQSHFANHPGFYTSPRKIVTVSKYAKDFIKSKYGRESVLLNNVVDVSDVLRNYPMQKFSNRYLGFHAAWSRRDDDVLRSFMSRTKMQVKLHPPMQRNVFLYKIQSRKFLLSWYRQDAFGLPPIQAMALGTIPVIFTHTTGKDYRIHGQNRFVFQPRQRAVWQDSWLTSIPQEKLIQMSRNGIQTAKKYVKSDAVDVLKKIYDETVQ